MRKLFKTGALFFIIQMSIAISYGADNLIVTHYLGAAALATYAVTAQLFGTVNQIVSIAMTPSGRPIPKRSRAATATGRSVR